MVDMFNAEWCPKSYWREMRSQEMVEREPNAILSSGNDFCTTFGNDEGHGNVSLIADLRKSRGLHSVSAYGHGAV